MKTKSILMSLVVLQLAGCSKKVDSGHVVAPKVIEPNSNVIEIPAPSAIVSPPVKENIVEEKILEIKTVQDDKTIKTPSNYRVWTSRDGKTVEAELLARTGDMIKIRRFSDHKEFTIPLQRISDSDQVYVANSKVATSSVQTPKTIVDSASDAVKIAASNFPEFKYIGYANEPSKPDIVGDPQCRDLYNSYKGDARFINRGTCAMLIKRMRDKIQSDKILLSRSYQDSSPVSMHISSNWYASRQNLRWLDQCLIPWLNKVESAK
jgi:hypothetical protein